MKNILPVLCFCALAIAGFGGAQTVMYIELPRIPPKAIGEQCTLLVRVRNAAGVLGWQAGLSFDPNVLQGNSVIFANADSFLRYAHGVTHNIFNVAGQWDNITGVLSYCMGLQLGTDSGGLGDGSLMKVIFDIVGAGSSILDLTQAAGQTQAFLADSAAYMLPFLCRDGFYGNETITPTSSKGISLVGGHQIQPSVTYNTTGKEFLAVWEDGQSGPVSYYIRGRRLSAIGDTIGAAINVYVGIAQFALSPEVNYNGARFMVAFTQKAAGTNNDFNILARSVETNGTVGSTINICSAVPRYQGNPAMVWNGSNHLVIWQDCRLGYYDPDIYGQLINSAGGLVGNNFLIAADSFWTAYGYKKAAEVFPRVASDGADYLVVWTWGNAGSSGAWTICGQLVNENGSLIGTSFSVAEGCIADVTWDGANYLVVYQKPNSSNDWDIYGQRVSSAGSLVGSEFAINTAPQDQTMPRVIYEPNSGKYLVVWVSEQSMPSIWRQAVNTNGTLYYGPSQQADANYHQMYPALTQGGSTGSMLIWADLRNGSNFDIYGYKNEIIGMAETPLSDDECVQPRLEIYPNPSNGKLRIIYSETGRAKRVDLLIYDAAGRLVKQFTQLPDNQLLDNQIFWTGNDDFGIKVPAGIYFVQLETGDLTMIKKLIMIR